MNAFLNRLLSQENQSMYRQQGVSYIGLFGSTARGEEKDTSDIDLLVDFNTQKTLFDLADIQFQLESSLDRKVDLVTRKTVKPDLMPYIEQDLITVYEQN